MGTIDIPRFFHLFAYVIRDDQILHEVYKILWESNKIVLKWNFKIDPTKIPSF